MIKRIFKSWVAWVVGVIIAALAISFWKNKEVDWDQIITLSIVGLIGGIIGNVIRRFYKKEQN